MTPVPQGLAAAVTSAEKDLMPGAELLPFDAIVRHARYSAMRVRVARSRLELGDAAVEGAGPLMVDNPQLYVGMGVRYNNNRSRFELQSTLNQPFEFGGERGLRIKAGKRYREYLDRELAQIQWETYAQMHYAYNMALLARARAITAERTLGFSSLLLEVAAVTATCRQRCRSSSTCVASSTRTPRCNCHAPEVPRDIAQARAAAMRKAAEKIAGRSVDGLAWVRTPPAGGASGSHWEKAIIELVEAGDHRFASILADHVERGVIVSARTSAALNTAAADAAA